MVLLSDFRKLRDCSVKSRDFEGIGECWTDGMESWKGAEMVEFNGNL